MARNALAALTLGLALRAPLALAQDVQGLVPHDVVTPQRSATGQEVEAAAKAQGVETRMVYARSTTGKGAAIAQASADRDRQDRVPDVGSGPVWAVVLALGVALALWLRFGGGGTLLARAPVEAKVPLPVPDRWRMDLSDHLRKPADLLDLIAAMPDRRAALVRLLRHCLMQAGEESQTRFARADTEREAFGRVPASWRRHRGLAVLLQAAELAHYGGRAVEAEGFDQAIATGRDILLRRANG